MPKIESEQAAKTEARDWIRESASLLTSVKSGLPECAQVSIDESSFSSHEQQKNLVFLPNVEIE